MIISMINILRSVRKKKQDKWKCPPWGSRHLQRDHRSVQAWLRPELPSSSEQNSHSQVSGTPILKWPELPSSSEQNAHPRCQPIVKLPSSPVGIFLFKHLFILLFLWYMSAFFPVDFSFFFWMLEMVMDWDWVCLIKWSNAFQEGRKGYQGPSS